MNSQDCIKETFNIASMYVIATIFNNLEACTIFFALDMEPSSVVNCDNKVKKRVRDIQILKTDPLSKLRVNIKNIPHL